MREADPALGPYPCFPHLSVPRTWSVGRATKQWCCNNQHLRVVIMSATIDCSHFAQYFAGSFPRCAQVPSEVLEEWKADTEEGLMPCEQMLGCCDDCMAR